MAPWIERLSRLWSPAPRRAPDACLRRVPVAPLLALTLTLLVLACGSAEEFPPGDETRVLVVARAGDASSERIARHYAEARGVAPSHVVFLPLPRGEEIPRMDFDERIAAPLAAWWRRTAASPDFVVLVKGVPHKIYGGGGLDGTRASVDSELCDLPALASGSRPPLEGRRRNVYGRAPDTEFPRFSAGRYGICLVTRLDGFEEADALALVDRALTAEARFQGAAAAVTPVSDLDSMRILLDLRASHDRGDDWLHAAAARLRDLPSVPQPDGAPPRPGHPGRLAPLVHLGHVAVELDTTPHFVTRARDLIGYAGWGSNDPAFTRPADFSWLPGALVTTFVSSSARTFAPPPAGWAPGGAEEFAGTRQSLTADWVRDGATGAAGNAYEPYLDGCVRPQILFAAYLSGRTLAESYYLALPYLSWQSVILGDPLCAPFAARASGALVPEAAAP